MIPMVFLDALKSLPPAVAISLLSLLVTLFVSVIYKFTTNQKVMKSIQEEMKTLRDKIKDTKDPTQAAELNKQLMEKTLQQTMQSMRSTLVTIVPTFLLLGWMTHNIAYAEIRPGEEFTTSIDFINAVKGEATIQADTFQLLSNATQAIDGNKVQWALKGEEGEHTITYRFGDEAYTRQVIITNDWKYADNILEKKKTLLGIINTGDANPIKPESPIRSISVNLKPVHPFGNLIIFGWMPGWLATYIILTLILTFPIRKLLNVY